MKRMRSVFFVLGLALGLASCASIHTQPKGMAIEEQATHQANLPSSNTVQEFVQNFPERGPGFRAVTKFVPEDANAVLIHIRQEHWSDESTVKELKQTNLIQEEIYRIIIFLHDRYGLPSVYLEGLVVESDETDWLHEFREEDALKKQWLKILEDSGKKTSLTDGYLQVENSLNYLLRIMQKDKEKLNGLVSYCQENPFAKECASRDIKLKLADYYLIEGKINALSAFITKLKKSLLYRDVILKLLRDKVVTVKPAEYLYCNQKAFVFSGALEQYHQNNGIQSDVLEDRTVSTAMLEEREYAALEIMQDDPDRLRAIVYGAAHTFRNNVEAWGQKREDDDPKKTPTRYALIEITPSSLYEDDQVFIKR